MKRLWLVILSALFIVVCLPGPAQATPASTGKVQELNFIFLHGMAGNSGTLQLLDDSLESQLHAHITNYEYIHPDVKVQTATLIRNYPNDVDIETWAKNIADSINQHFSGKKNLVIIGHSMGGKAALYTVSHNIGNLASKVVMVVTINSPIKSLANYYYVGGDSALDYWGARSLLPNRGVIESLVNYDSSQDGQWVSANKHWLAFISAESSPLSRQFDIKNVDALPREMDDNIVPISAQYADGADTVYYGEYGHSDFSELGNVADYMADQILSYIFGGNIECSVLARAGAFEHKASLFPGTDYWQDLVGGVLTGSGTLIHKNRSFFKWQEWKDIVGESSGVSMRSSYQTLQRNSFPILTGIKESSWANPDDPGDSRISLTTRAAPGSSVQVDWSIYDQGLLPPGITRDHYEVELETGSQFTSIGQVAWETSDLRDLRLRIGSQAESPFRWFRAQWKVYIKENRQRKIIEEFAAQNLQD
jgi:pimeloyl-ACP methyl ester carboxylesterase